MDLNGKRLRLLYPDIHGLERGKYLFGKVAESGHAAFCVAGADQDGVTRAGRVRGFL